MFKKPYGLFATFTFMAVSSLVFASVFIFFVSEYVIELYTADTAVTVGYALKTSFYFTLFGMWLLFGILMFVLRFKVIVPILQLSESMHDVSKSLDWSHRVRSSTGIRELDMLATDFNMLVSAVQRNHDILHESSIRDPLTGLLNRRGFEDAFQCELDRAERFSTHFSIILIDLDKFKFINDTYGHPAGDEVLKELARRLGGSLRKKIDYFARMGGDEFLIILPEIDPDNAKRVAIKLNRLIF
ncbi:MAG: GGDEF domain-containing protein, partial [Methylococcaceae bacterium]